MLKKPKTLILEKKARVKGYYWPTNFVKVIVVKKGARSKGYYWLTNFVTVVVVMDPPVETTDRPFTHSNRFLVCSINFGKNFPVIENRENINYLDSRSVLWDTEQADEKPA